MKKLVIIPIFILISLIFISCNNDDKKDSVINLTTNTNDIITTPDSKTDAPTNIFSNTIDDTYKTEEKEDDENNLEDDGKPWGSVTWF